MGVTRYSVGTRSRVLCKPSFKSSSLAREPVSVVGRKEIVSRLTHNTDNVKSSGALQHFNRFSRLYVYGKDIPSQSSLPELGTSSSVWTIVVCELNVLVYLVPFAFPPPNG